jgi:hypothetical protein
LADGDKLEETMARSQPLVTICLTGVAISLLLVGVASGTFIRHIIQILPVVIALMMVLQRPSWGSYAAIAVFLFWFVIMSIIWLYLLNIAKIISGHFSTTEVVLTVLIGCFSFLGLIGSARLGTTTRFIERITAFILFARLQYGAMVLSFQRLFANR